MAELFWRHQQLCPASPSPFPAVGQKPAIRTGIGLFSERSGPGPIFDILRYDGHHLNRYVLSGAQVPAFPIPPGAAFPSSIHRLSQNVGLPNALQFSFGFERQLAKKTTLAVSYTGVRSTQQFRSRDANAPLPPAFSARPDSTLNVLRLIESAGRVEGNSLEVTVRGNLSRKVTGTIQYVLNKSSRMWRYPMVPGRKLRPIREWGRADTDRRHQFNSWAYYAASLANFGLSVSLLPASRSTSQPAAMKIATAWRLTALRRHARQGSGQPAASTCAGTAIPAPANKKGQESHSPFQWTL